MRLHVGVLESVVVEDSVMILIGVIKMSVTVSLQDIMYRDSDTSVLKLIGLGLPTFKRVFLLMALLMPTRQSLVMAVRSYRMRQMGGSDVRSAHAGLGSRLNSGLTNVNQHMATSGRSIIAIQMV